LKAHHRSAGTAAATSATETTLDELEKVFSGTFPWQSGSEEATGDVMMERHFALQWRTAKHRLARTEEENELLGKEVSLLHNWLEERLAAVNDKIVRLERESTDGTTECAATQVAHEAKCADVLKRAAKQSRNAGQLVLLAQEKERLECILADARKRLPLTTR